MYTVDIIIVLSTCTWITQQQNFWIEIHFYVLYRDSDRVWKKMIVQDIVWDCTILCQTNVWSPTSYQSKHTFSFAITLSNSSCNGYR